MTVKDRATVLFGCFAICITAASFMVAVPFGLFVLGMDFLVLACGAWVASKANVIVEEIKSDAKVGSVAYGFKLHKMAHDFGSSILGITREQAEQYAGPAPSKSTEVIGWYRKAWEAMQEEGVEE